METIGLIAGDGQFPILFAEGVKKDGLRVVAVGLKDITNPILNDHVDKLHWIRVGQLGGLIKALKSEKIKKVVMAGKVPKTLMFTKIRPDMRAVSLYIKLKDSKDDSILLGIVSELEKEGIMVEEPTRYLSYLLAEKGVITKKRPTKDEMRDIEFGFAIAKEMGRLDIGQTVVVKDRAVLAVEAIEGTDEAIKRGGELGRGGVVVIKAAKPKQDMRFDAPVIGLNTIRTLKEAKAAALCVEAGKTILLEKEEMIKLADREKICIIGV
ncbi:MAG: UDP-2,3-diacylglucosamine diphosphatase LpxI [Nitrospirae bacterium]|nr:UDP-2,3-diacylglucosamine diphosphatase LpxI [Nitrospirota bacterium]